MKKLMIAASAALCVTVGFSDVTSANVVGYQNVTTAWTDGDEETQFYGFPNIGATFQPVGYNDSGLFRLGDVKVIGLMASEGETFYQLDPESADPLEDEITYVDRENAKAIINPKHPEQVSDEAADEIVGWWNPDFDESLDDDEYPIGSAFLGADLSGDDEVIWVCNGEAQPKAVNVPIDGVAFPHFANPIPRTITWGEVKCVGINASEGETFYHLDPGSADPLEDEITYVDRENAKAIINPKHPEQVSDEAADEIVGWWNPDFDEDLSDIEVKSGECWIGADLPGNDDVVVSFPKAY